MYDHHIGVFEVAHSKVIQTENTNTKRNKSAIRFVKRVVLAVAQSTDDDSE